LPQILYKSEVLAYNVCADFRLKTRQKSKKENKLKQVKLNNENKLNLK